MQCPNESASDTTEQANSRGSWASSIVNLKNSQADVLLENVLDSTSQVRGSSSMAVIVEDTANFSSFGDFCNDYRHL